MNLFNIAYSGLQAARTGLNITANNISNVRTPGYSRQRMLQYAIAPGNFQGRLSSGDGVGISGIQRIADQYRIGQVWSSTTGLGYHEQGQLYFDGLETKISSDSSGLRSGFDNFFNALKSASEKPDEKTGRGKILDEAKSLATRINGLQKYIQTQKSDIRKQQQEMAGTINSLNKNIAQYNVKIREAEARGDDTSALRDGRDEQVKSLSELVDVRVNENAKGEYDVTLPDGHPLVSGSDSSELKMRAGAGGEFSMVVKFLGTESQVDMSCGGKLGALYDYQKETLKPVEDKLPGIVETFTKAINDQLGKGFDLNGAPGKPLFTFDLDNPQGMLKVNDLQADDLAFSSESGVKGNNKNLLELIKIKTATFDIPNSGKTSLDDASNSLINHVATKSRQNQEDLKSAADLAQSAQDSRDSYSGVDYDQEYVNMNDYTQAYQANSKVIATGNEIFNSLLSLF